MRQTFVCRNESTSSSRSGMLLDYSPSPDPTQDSNKTVHGPRKIGEQAAFQPFRIKFQAKSAVFSRSNTMQQEAISKINTYKALIHQNICFNNPQIIKNPFSGKKEVNRSGEQKEVNLYVWKLCVSLLWPYYIRIRFLCTILEYDFYVNIFFENLYTNL